MKPQQDNNAENILLTLALLIIILGTYSIQNINNITGLATYKTSQPINEIMIWNFNKTIFFPEQSIVTAVLNNETKEMNLSSFTIRQPGIRGWDLSYLIVDTTKFELNTPTQPGKYELYVFVSYNNITIIEKTENITVKDKSEKNKPT